MLPTDEVHVWRADLDQPVERVRELWRLLTPGERERADRFQPSVQRHHFVVGRAVLRMLLGSYLGEPPQGVGIDHLTYGKPILRSGGGGSPLEFNLAHSGGLGLYAFCMDRVLGLDVEHMRPRIVDWRLAECFFSPREVATLRALAPPAQATAFLRCWTRKEAYLKARGDGLTVALDSFDVTLAPGERPALLANRHEPCEVTRWSFHDLAVPPGYLAALVVAGSGWRLVNRGWVGEPQKERDPK